ncbi:MAG TPA: hypothetical protein VJQ44_15590 [Gemmatimonadales bacterium]|nr:hypothetical protein [Gemmatimonadales bacterium]
MYRIEVRPGEETVFRTIEELATGIRNGFITPRARIYHAASQKWLPIEFHPHYKKALAGNFTPAPPSPQPSLAAMPAPTFAFPSAASAPPSSTPAEPIPTSNTAPVITAPSRQRQPSPKAPPPGASAAESPVLAMRAAVRHAHVDLDEADAEGPVERYSPVPAVGPRGTGRAQPPQPTALVEAVEAAEPVAVEDLPETPQAVALPEAPRLAPTPELVLPNITYPEVPPTQPEQRATARRSRRTGGRPLLIIGSAAVLVLGGQRYLASRAPAGALGSEPVVEVPAPPADPRPAAPPRSATATAPVPAQHMQPGPAFAASVRASGVAPPPLPPAARIVPPPSASDQPGPSAGDGIAPAPGAIDLVVPSALPEDSIAAAVGDGRDSLAMKRILKAVSGRKANPSAP